LRLINTFGLIKFRTYNLIVMIKRIKKNVLIKLTTYKGIVFGSICAVLAAHNCSKNFAQYYNNQFINIKKLISTASVLGIVFIVKKNTDKKIMYHK